MHDHRFQSPKRRSARLGAIAGALALVLTLAACGGSDPDNSPSPTPSDTPASATPSATPTVDPTVLTDLSSIDVTGDWGTEPTVNAPYPFKVDETMTKVVIQGTGTEVPSATATVNMHYVGINARSGSVFDSSWISGAPTTFQLSGVITGFAKGIVGQRVGSRLAIAITSSEAYDPNGQASIGVDPGDTLLFVVDILDSELAGPVGSTVTPPDGLPVVTETADGVPQISIPAGLAEPTEVGVQPLIQGSGAALQATDALTSHAVCVTWDGTEYYNDYGSASVTDAASAAVHQALFNALVGQQVGSRVLVTLPGSVAYPTGNRTPSIAPNTSVACVVDLLFTQAYS